MFSVYYRVFNRNSSFCNNHCDPCFGETTRARYDCISIKTWGCFISMCILKVVLSSFFFYILSKLKIFEFIIPLFGRFIRGMGPNPVLMELKKRSTYYYDLYNFYTNQRHYHTSYSSKYTQFRFMLTIICINPKQKQLPSLKCTFLEWNKNSSL